MQAWQGTRCVTVISAVMNSQGYGDFAITQVEVTHEQVENGIHLYLAEADLLEAGYEEPFVHFPEGEAPAFLLPAVRRYLRRKPGSANPAPLTVANPQEDRCPE
jgi:hypothetical protein